MCIPHAPQVAVRAYTPPRNLGNLVKFRRGHLVHELLQALRETAVTDQVSDQVKALLKCLGRKPASDLECMKKLGLSHRPTFRKITSSPRWMPG